MAQIELEGLSKKLDATIKSIDSNLSAGIEHYARQNKYQVNVYNAEGNMIISSDGMFKHELSSFIETLPTNFNQLKQEFQNLKNLL